MHNFEQIRGSYAEAHKQYGDTSAAQFTPKGRHEERFRPAIELLKRGSFRSILDYGCGLGFLLEHLIAEGVPIEYTGWDITPSFISSCNRRFGSIGNFKVIDPLAPLSGSFDAVVCSGVFNLSTSQDSSASLEYVRTRLASLLSIAREFLLCDFLSPYVDFTQPDAQHIDPSTVVGWLIDLGFRRFQIRHDLLPYEYSILVFRNSQIIRPKNVYEDLLY